MDVGGYMRVSRKGDRDPDQWLTVPAQRNAIESWARDHGHRLTDLREDIDVSGALDDRPNLEALIVQVERGELGGVVVAKVDRFSRDLAYGAMVARRIERAGGTFVAADDGVVIGPGGRDFGGNDTAHFLFAQLLSMADFFRRRNVQGWKQVRERHVLERGRHWGYAPPFGYVQGEDGVLVPDPVFGPLVPQIFERRAGGEGASSIARWLDRHGARSARGGRPTHRYILDILRNRVYLGEVRAGELVKEDAHQPLVDEGLFAAAARQAGAPPRRAPSGPADAPALSGLVRCWACRTVMTGAWANYQGGRRRVYRCRRRHAHGDCPAPATASERELLALVMPVFWGVLARDAEVRVLDDADDSGEALAARLDRARRALEVYRDAEDVADMEPAAFAQGLRVRVERVREAKAAVGQWQSSRAREPVDADSLRTVWPNLLPSEQGQLIGDVVGAIVVRRPQGNHRGHEIPLGGRTAVLLVDDLPRDLPRNGRRCDDRPRPFLPFDDESVPWVPLGQDPGVRRRDP